MAKKKQDEPEKKRPEQRRRSIVRVLGTDTDGDKSVKYAILKVKGVGQTMANAICEATDIDPKQKLGALSENEIEQLENYIREPEKLGIPSWIMNRRKDIETGKDMHVSSTDVEVTEKFDIQRMVDKHTYKGVRHMLGLPVRGQRTRSSFRRGGTVGVVRKAARMQQQGSKKPKK